MNAVNTEDDALVAYGYFYKKSMEKILKKFSWKVFEQEYLNSHQNFLLRALSAVKHEPTLRSTC